MSGITRRTSAEEIAVLVSQALDSSGITATLSGGGAVSVYTDNEYESRDLDFVTNAGNDAIAKVLAPLGFRHVPGVRQFEHPESDFYVEFPPGPLAFGETVVRDCDVPVLRTKFGALRVVTPTQSVMDRVAAYVHWNDRQALDQAVMVGRRQQIDWKALGDWARAEGADSDLIGKLRERVGAGD
jgi:hypothetical protein